MGRLHLSLRRRTLIAGLVSSLLILNIADAVVHAADGDLDTSFDTDGVASINISGTGLSDYGAAVAVQPDGKIIMGGAANSHNDFGLIRLNPNGTFDTTFSGDGKQISNLVAGADEIVALAIQSDGKIIAGGIAHNGTNMDYVVARYLTNGSLDTTFDTDGFNTVSLSSDHDYAEDVLVQPDGKIIIIGSTTNATDDIGMARFNSNGTLDSTFGSGGKVTTAISGSTRDNGYGAALQSDGKIVVVGAVLNSSLDIAVVRYNSDGSLDTTFDTDGKVSTDVGGIYNEGKDVVIQSDGKIVVSATSQSASTGTDFMSLRYNSNGTLDTSYSGDGVLPITVGSGTDIVYASALQTDDKLLISGTTTSGSNQNMAVVRVKTDGTLDTSFGTSGIFTKDYSSQNEEALDIAVQPNGRVVFAGYTDNATNQFFLLGRVLAASTNANLSSITATGATFTPTFSNSTSSYSSSVSNSVTSLTLTPTTSDANAIVQVNGVAVTSGTASGSIALAVGLNTVTVGVTAQDGVSTKTFTFSVTRAAAPTVDTTPSTSGNTPSPTTTVLSTNALLANVSISNAVLTPSFSSSTTNYTATVSNGTKSITVSSTVTDATATVKVNGSVVASGSTSSAIALSPGSNTITVVGTAQDGVTTKTYTFIITRDVATVKLKKTITAKSILGSKDITLASTSKVVITVKASSKKYCSVIGTKAKGVKKGNCTVVVSVTPKATKTVKKPKTTKTTVTIRVV